MSAFLPVFAYAALVFWLSSLPAVDPPGELPHVDKLLHLGEYGILGLLLARAWFHAGVHRGGWLVLCTVLTGCLLGALDELWQGVVGREQSVFDWLADCAGVTLAALIWKLKPW